MTTDELRKLDSKAINEELSSAQKELFKVKFEVINNQSKNIHVISKSRKYIAQIKTVMKEKENQKDVETEPKNI